MSGVLHGHVLSLAVYFLEMLPLVSITPPILPLTTNITLQAVTHRVIKKMLIFYDIFLSTGFVGLAKRQDCQLSSRVTLQLATRSFHPYHEVGLIAFAIQNRKQLAEAKLHKSVNILNHPVH
jgi:hypothetical protein